MDFHAQGTHPGRTQRGAIGMFSRLEFNAKQIRTGLHQKCTRSQAAVAAEAGYVNCRLDA